MGCQKGGKGEEGTRRDKRDRVHKPPQAGHRGNARRTHRPARRYAGEQ